MPLLPLAAALLIASVDGGNPWGTGPEAPPPDEVAPVPTAPREPGATIDPLDVPARPPEPVRPPLDVGVLSPTPEARLVTTRARDQLLVRGALDLDTALVGVPGLCDEDRRGAGPGPVPPVADYDSNIAALKELPCLRS